MDFLDNLDDPNFNPFETKTKVVELFGDSKEEDMKKDIVNIGEETKPFTKKPMVKKAVKKMGIKFYFAFPCIGHVPSKGHV